MRWPIMAEPEGTRMASLSANAPVVLVGHPFAPIGVGQVLRSAFRALRAAHVPVMIVDAYGRPDQDPHLAAEFGQFVTDRVGDGIGIFCMNGDEVARVFEHMGARAEGPYRIVIPMWELANYPAVWARQLERFDEVWAASAFIHGSVARSVSVPVHHLPLAIEPRLRQPFGRRAFGLPESSYLFLFAFDFTSFIQRKNPFAALDAFQRVLEARPAGDVRFVIKLNSSGARPNDRKQFLEFLGKFGDRVILLDRTLSDAEILALHLCCDAYVALHRSEGYGFGLAEAMFFKRPVLATAYSGNLDFMSADCSFLLDYRLVPVPDGAYPHAAGQVWAEPDVRQAAEIMVRLVDDPDLGRALGEAASRHIRTHFSHRAIGLRYAARLAAVAAAWQRNGSRAGAGVAISASPLN